MSDLLEQRKAEHLDLAMRPEAEPEGNDPLFCCVRLVHCALPELRLSQIDLSARFAGARLAAPIVIAGMTGGTPRAAQLNRDLAQVAEEAGVAFGVGSMRAALDAPELLSTFDVRPARPPLFLANLGAQQLVRTPDAVERLMEPIGAGGLCVHLNPAQELVQEEGDRDFSGCEEAIGRLAARLGERLVVKETGCGLSPEVARRLVARGVQALDVSGLGGTSWTRIEGLRATLPAARVLGAALSGWGIPTAASLCSCRAALGPGVQLCASGGIRSGLDVARAIAMGADVAGVALPLLRAHAAGGLEGARLAMRSLIGELRAVCLLTGSADLASLRAKPKVLLEPLASWLRALADSGVAAPGASARGGP
jgi:isopentenyl-diphosphate delta-isomerase